MVWSDGLPLKRGAGLHIPLLEQFMIVSCGETNSKHESEYMQVHIRLTGKYSASKVNLHFFHTNRIRWYTVRTRTAFQFGSFACFVSHGA